MKGRISIMRELPKHTVKIGIAWYRKDQWERLLEISNDRDLFEDTYEEWLALSEQHLKITRKKVRKLGVDVEPVDFDLDEYLEYCKHTNAEVNAESTASFITEKLNQKYSKK